MKNKKIFLFAFLSLFLVGCDSIGGLNLTDTRGNKYNFKNESVTCENILDVMIYCEGSAIKKDIAGQRYVVEFPRTYCANLSQNWISDDLICSAGKELGEF